MSSLPNKTPPVLPTGPDTSAASKSAKLPLRVRSPILAHLRAAFIAGLFTVIPLLITIYILTFFYGFITTPTQNLSDWLVDHLFGTSKSAFMGTLHSVIAGVLALIFALLVVYILGLLGTFFIGRQILRRVEHFIENLPLIKGIYGTTKQVMDVFQKSGGGSGFQRVVLVQFPREGTWTVAFVTNTIVDRTARPGAAAGAGERKLCCCFIPMTPNPTSGFFQMFPEEQLMNTDWTVDVGIKIVLSGGLLAPHELQATPSIATKQDGNGSPVSPPST